MACAFLGVTAPSPTLQQDVLIALALAVFALFLPTLLVVRAAREALEKGHSSEQEHASKKLPLLPPAGASVKTARRKKRKVRKNGKTTVGRRCGQDSLADNGRQGPSDNDDIGAALEAAWSGSEAVDATLKTRLRAGSFGATGGQPMAAPLLSASASQIELKEAEINELPGVAEPDQSDEFSDEVQELWQPSVWRDGMTHSPPIETDQETKTAIFPNCLPDASVPQEAQEPQCKPEQVAEYGPEWGCMADRRYGRMVFLLHREIRAETLRRCPPGLGPLPGSPAVVTEEPVPCMQGFSTRRLKF